MNILLLSGGSGKRLWPLSNDIHSKQFIKIFKKNNCGNEYDEHYESMVQRVYKQIKEVDNNALVTIATNKSQVSLLRNQLDDNIKISVEPCRKDTFPAIVLATCFLHDVCGVSGNEAIVVCPVDPYVDIEYFKYIHKLWSIAQQGEGNIVLMGVNPTYPSEKYGYIIPHDASSISKVKAFKEKPNKYVAQKYIESGGLWNGGIFAFKIDYLLNRAHNLIDFIDYYDFYDKYSTIDKISFDYAIVESEPNITVLRFNGEWKDVGTWNTLTEVMEGYTIGNVRLDNTCKNVHVINELEIPILAMGLNDVIISASPQGILVSDKEQSGYIKQFVNGINKNIMFAEKSWGKFKVLDISNTCIILKIILKSGHNMSYHSHDHRDEIWTVVSGTGRTVVDGMMQPVKAGDVITMATGCRHTVFADTELQLIEVQLGNDISVNDKHKYELDI